jgi:hypothetical protein
MVAPNKQPAGSRPGPKAPNTHAPHAGGVPSQARATSPKAQGVASHGTPKPTGNGKKNPLR